MEMTKEELEKLKDFKVYVFEGDVYVKAEDYKKIAIENKKLKEENEKMRKHIRENGYIDDVAYIKKENKKLKEELGEYKKMFEDQLKEAYIKNTAEFLDKKFPKVNGFMEEDTLQELKDIGEL